MRFADNETAQALMTAALDSIMNGIDAGGAGELVITTTAFGEGTDLATLPFGATAYAGAAWSSGDNWTAANLTDGTAIAESDAEATGTAAGFRIVSGAGTTLFEGSVTTTVVGTGDIELDSVSITATQTVTLTALEFRLPEGP